MKRVFQLILMVAGVMAVQVIMSNTPANENRLIEAFKQSEFAIQESKITATVDLGKSYINENKKQAAIREFAKALGLDENYELVSNTKTSKKEMILTKHAKNAETTIKILTNEKTIGSNVKEVQNYFIIELTIQYDLDSILYFKERIDKLLKERNLDTNVVINMYGEKEGQFSQEEKEEVAHIVFQYMEGEPISEYNEGNIYNAYGYTPNIKEFIRQQEQKINLDLAITYNEEEDKTYFYMATPIITLDY